MLKNTLFCILQAKTKYVSHNKLKLHVYSKAFMNNFSVKCVCNDKVKPADTHKPSESFIKVRCRFVLSPFTNSASSLHPPSLTSQTRRAETVGPAARAPGVARRLLLPMRAPAEMNASPGKSAHLMTTFINLAGRAHVASADSESR